MKCNAPLLLVGAAVAALSFSASAFAFNELFAARGPLSHLTKADIKLAGTAIRTALDQEPDGNTQTWNNPQTNASGTVTPQKTFTMKGMRCRQVEFTTHAGGQASRSEWNLCKQKDGVWKIVTGT